MLIKTVTVAIEHKNIAIFITSMYYMITICKIYMFKKLFVITKSVQNGLHLAKWSFPQRNGHLFYELWLTGINNINFMNLW
jgi:hypothetical protein